MEDSGQFQPYHLSDFLIMRSRSVDNCSRLNLTARRFYGLNPPGFDNDVGDLGKGKDICLQTLSCPGEAPDGRIVSRKSGI